MDQEEREESVWNEMLGSDAAGKLQVPNTFEQGNCISGDGSVNRVIGVMGVVLVDDVCDHLSI